MAERGISLEDIEMAMRRRLGSPEPGNRGNTMVVRGKASQGRTLCVVIPANDETTYVTVYWEEEQ